MTECLLYRLQLGGPVDQPVKVAISRPILSDDMVVWFSAYGFGWGYRAFALPFEVVCQKFGAASPTPKQVLLAFELGKWRILQLIGQKIFEDNPGERTVLAEADFSAGT